ncbi:fibronectin type III-like domain-contianing protein [Vibrio zhugei]|uniref:fibronectin type III-like domain-contianing protein n=1 Tax=Vibrio zhugei TaxID=2479546 RepID=UPI001F545418|nr:fibronectin type III-like domain-contianing protein [Vibrio zhugei]
MSLKPLQNGAAQRGERCTVTMSVTQQRLASFNPERNVWVLVAGDYHVYVAPSSDLSEVTALTVHIEHDIVVEHTTKGALT